jgi:hypothetical protein
LLFRSEPPVLAKADKAIETITLRMIASHRLQIHRPSCALSLWDTMRRILARLPQAVNASVPPTDRPAHKQHPGNHSGMPALEMCGTGCSGSSFVLKGLQTLN